jgi:hypothetical protein
MLSAFVNKETQQDWDEYLPLLMMAYRSSVHKSTGVSPCEMVFGRPINLPIDLVLGSPRPVTETPPNKAEYSFQLANKLQTIHEFARNKLQLSSKHMIK